MGRLSKNVPSDDGLVFRPCCFCKEEKPLDEFYALTPSPNGFKRWSSNCQICFVEIRRETLKTLYYADIQKARRKGREIAEKKRRPKLDFVNSIKAQTPCADCQRIFPPICLDFDHLPGSEKIASISVMASGTAYSIEEVRREIEKCELVCANCHRLRTKLRDKWRKPVKQLAS